ncbi:MAG: single-stranded-DNA-specific exonuclease RecJ, partial [Syntrophomonadaceae bacterium]
GMAAAVARIESAVRRQEKVVIYGDYDVDGICSIVILVECLQQLGCAVDYYVPNRFTEGYGLNSDAVRILAGQGYRLLITVDCGISSVDEVKTAADLGMDVIITDHHTPPAHLPEAQAIINPKIGCPAEAADLAGAGVAFKLASALSAGRNAEEQVREWLVLTALATVADMVPLHYENRIIAKYGLQAMPASQRVGLRKLIEEVGLAGQSIQAWQLGFVLSPRLNAAGRMGSARASIELLMSRDGSWAQEQARLLSQMNEERRQVEENIVGEAVAIIEAHMDLERESILVVDGEGWNVGVIGIVASRLTDLYSRPAMVISWNGDIGKASARSQTGFDLYAALDSVSGSLLGFGGHKMAAGLSVHRNNLELIKTGLKDYAARTGYRWEAHKRYSVDLEIEEDDISLPVLEELQRLEPFGEGNPLPAFVLRGQTIQQTSRVGVNGNHLRLAVGSNYLAGIAFNGAESLENHFPYCSQDLLFTLAENNYKGKKTVQLKVKDIKSSFYPDDRSRGGVTRSGLWKGLTRAVAELAQQRPVVVVYPTYRSLAKHQGAMDYYFYPGKVLPIHGHLSREERSQRQELLSGGTAAVYMMTASSLNLFLEQAALPINCRYAARLWPLGPPVGDGGWPQHIEVEEIQPCGDYSINRDSGDLISGERVLIYANLPATIKRLRGTWPDIRVESGLSDMGQRIRIRRSYWSDPQGTLVSDGSRTVVWSTTDRFDRLILMDSPLGWYELSLLAERWGEAGKHSIGVAFGPAALTVNRQFLDRLYPSLEAVNKVWTHLLRSAPWGGRYRVGEIAASLNETLDMSRLEIISSLRILADLNLCHLQKRSSIMAINRGTSGKQIDSLGGSPHWREGIAERMVLSDWEERLISSLEW